MLEISCRGLSIAQSVTSPIADYRSMGREFDPGMATYFMEIDNKLFSRDILPIPLIHEVLPMYCVYAQSDQSLCSLL